MIDDKCYESIAHEALGINAAKYIMFTNQFKEQCPYS